MGKSTRLGVVFGAALGLGAALAYLFDPDRGRRRRAMTGDRMRSAVGVLEDAFAVTSRDVRNRLVGSWAALRSRRGRDRASDDVLTARIRAGIGTVVRHPRALAITTQEGRVTVRGPVLADEADRLIAYVRRVRGVRDVESRLDVHHESDRIPALQGQPAPPGPRSMFMQTAWSPTARLIAGAAGAFVAAYGIKAPRAVRPVAWVTGLGLAARAITNLDLRRLLGVGGGGHAAIVQKTITVATPVAEAFQVWSRYENFPKFMEHVVAVHRTHDGRSHWTVRGPGGVPVHWEAVETVREHDRRLAWTTAKGSWIAHEGTVHFDATPDAGTRIDIKLFYTPPAGAIGHTVAALLGQDPKRALDEALVRFKSLLEDGRTRAHGRHVTRDELTVPRRDDVGRTGVWPVSGPLPDGDAPIVRQGELGNPPGPRHAAEEAITDSGFETDPVCGGRVNVQDAERREYNGHVYYFDCIACCSRFDEQPERFTRSLAHRRPA